MHVNGEAVDIRTSDGVMDAYIASPGEGSPFPLVVMFMDIWGLREELFGLARMVAEQGYYCVLPNLFYRKGKVRYDYRNAGGRSVSFDTIPDALKTEMLGLARGLTRQMIKTDVEAIFDFVRDKPVSAGPAGTVGFCLGGRIGFFAAQAFPARFHAVSSLHGTLLVTDAADSVHRMMDGMAGEVYFGHGELDRASTPDIVAALDAACDGNKSLVRRSRMHKGAHHGYSMPDRDVHDAAATAIDWQETLSMFARQLKPGLSAPPSA